MTDLRTAAQQALEYMKSVGQMDMYPEEWAIVERLEAALAEPVQAKPDHETRAEIAEQQVVQLAEERDHYRSLWLKAQQAEPVQEPCKGDPGECEFNGGCMYACAKPEPVQAPCNKSCAPGYCYCAIRGKK